VELLCAWAGQSVASAPWLAMFSEKLRSLSLCLAPLVVERQPCCGTGTGHGRGIQAGQTMVLVLDPGGEIGGTAAAVHSSLGLARRVPVPACKSQLSALSEAIENLSPDVVLVDRMQVDTAIAAARLCRDAGVRFVGTVLGSFQSCLHCLAEHVQANGSRVSKRDVPVDALAEMPRCFAHAWKLVLDAAQAVEAFLAGTPPDVQIRERS